jgi:hypothetical protein
MKFRSTLILLLVAIGFGAYIFFVEKDKPGARQAAEDAKKVVALDRDKISAITIKSAEATIELRKGANDVWTMEAPVKDRANTMTISSLMTAAEFLNFTSIIGEDKPVEKEQLKDFGLASAETKVTFISDGKPVELQFGKDAAIEGKVYVKLADSKKVYVISNDLKNQITKRPDEFRDRKLTDLDTEQVQKLAIKTPAGEIEAEKKNEHWSLTKPLKARGDDTKIRDIISQASAAHIESFVADSANLAAFGLDQPRGTVSLFVEGRDKPSLLQIGANLKEEKEKDKIYAKLSTREAVVVLPKTIEALLATKPNDLREKNLVRFEPDIVDRVAIEAAGKEKVVLARKGESWVRLGEKETPINAATATRLLNDMKNQLVSEFVSDVATELEKYGLDQPSVKVTLSSYSSENTPETKAGERQIVTIIFGKTEGVSVYAKLDDEPFIVSVPTQTVTSIPTDPLQWQDETIYTLKPEEITSLEVTKGDQPTFSIEREKDKWKLAKGDGTLNQVAVQSLVNTLATLRAVRWIGAANPEDGFEKPAVIVIFKTSGNIGGKLTLGALVDDGWRAAAEGLTGTFAVSKPDAEALMLALIEKPAAPAPASPTAPPTPAPTPPPPLPPSEQKP